MVSRKRNQGKARKAKAKAREEAEERRRNNQTTNGPQQQSLAAQMQQLQVTCVHGHKKIGDICAKFVFAFRDAFNDAARGGDRTIFHCLQWARKATLNEFAVVWKDSAKMEMVVSFFLCNGTEHFLAGNNRYARNTATFARYFEQCIAVELHQTQALINWPKIVELDEGDEHTLVKFFRVRIPCSCLDKKYEEVKHITKIGICWNPQCSLPKGMVERSETMYCSRCRLAIYCSRECQKADWLAHKDCCDISVATKAEFDAAEKQPNSPSI